MGKALQTVSGHDSRPLPAWLLELDRLEYRAALKLQHRAVAARARGLLEQDLVIVLEHPPVFTLGRRAGLDNLTVDREFLAKRGIEVVHAERGGDITFHGPGQLVAYPIVRLEKLRLGVADYVTALEKAMVLTATVWDIEAAGNPEARGVWVDGRKLGSIGISVRRGVSFHGLALNVDNDLTPFSWINPCGIRGCRMTSLAQEAGCPVDMGRARKILVENLARVLGLEPEPVSPDRVEDLLDRPIPESEGQPA